jgi:hypothetical protein
MFKKTVADQARHVLPVVVPLVGDFLLQDGTDRDVTVANAYPNSRNCRKNARLRTPSTAATTMVTIPRISMA